MHARCAKGETAMTTSSKKTANACRAAMAWYIKKMGLQAWKIGLFVSAEPPPAMGETHPKCLGKTVCTSSEKDGDLWVSPERSVAYGDPTLQTLFHELIHISHFDCGLSTPGNGPDEFYINRMATLVERAYRKETRAGRSR